MTKSKFVPTHMRLVTNNGVFAYKGKLYEKVDAQNRPIDHPCPEGMREEMTEGPKARFRMVGEDGKVIPNAHDAAIAEAKAAERASRTTTSGRVRATTEELLGKPAAEDATTEDADAGDDDWMEEADGVAVVNNGGGWFDVVADWLPQAQKVQGADEAKAAAEKLRAEGDPSEAAPKTEEAPKDEGAPATEPAKGEAPKVEETPKVEEAPKAEEAPTTDKPQLDHDGDGKAGGSKPKGVTITTKSKASGDDTDGAQQA